jgi:WD40 repeat protein
MCFEDHEEQITCMTRDWTGNLPYYIATADLDGKVVVRDMRAGEHRVLSSFSLGSPVQSIRLSQYSPHLISILPERLVITEQHGAEVGSLPCYQVSSLATDGIFAVTGREEGELQLWETLKGSCVHQWSDIQGVTAVVSDLLGENIAAGNLEGVLYYISDSR